MFVGSDLYCAILLNLRPRTADTFFTDFAYVLVTCSIRFTFSIASLRQLYHNEFTVTFILIIELHDSVGGGSGAGEKVENYS